MRFNDISIKNIKSSIFDVSNWAFITRAGFKIKKAKKFSFFRVLKDPLYLLKNKIHA